METLSPKGNKKLSKLKELLRATEQTIEGAPQSYETVWLMRAIRVVYRAALVVETNSLRKATSAPTDFEALLEALTPLAVFDPDPYAQARLRGLEHTNALLAYGGKPLGVEDVAKVLGMTPQGVNRRRQQGRLFALQSGKRGYLYPMWQFDPTRENGVIPGLAQVLATLGNIDSWGKLMFLVDSVIDDPEERGRALSPLEALKQGHLEPVLRAARTYGEHGTL